MTGSPSAEPARFAERVQDSFPPLSPTETTQAIGVVGAQFHPAFEFGRYWLRSDDPVDLLRLLAIGYGELCWPGDHDLTPEEAWVAGFGDGSLTGWVAPAAFRAWDQWADQSPACSSASSYISNASVLEWPSATARA